MSTQNHESDTGNYRQCGKPKVCLLSNICARPFLWDTECSHSSKYWMKALKPMKSLISGVRERDRSSLRFFCTSSYRLFVFIRSNHLFICKTNCRFSHHMHMIMLKSPSLTKHLGSQIDLLSWPRHLLYANEQSRQTMLTVQSLQNTGFQSLGRHANAFHKGSIQNIILGTFYAVKNAAGMVAEMPTLVGGYTDYFIQVYRFSRENTTWQHSCEKLKNRSISQISLLFQESNSNQCNIFNYPITNSPLIWTQCNVTSQSFYHISDTKDVEAITNLFISLMYKTLNTWQMSVVSTDLTAVICVKGYIRSFNAGLMSVPDWMTAFPHIDDCIDAR